MIEDNLVYLSGDPPPTLPCLRNPPSLPLPHPSCFPSPPFPGHSPVPISSPSYPSQGTPPWLACLEIFLINECPTLAETYLWDQTKIILRYLKTNYCLARRYGCKNYTIWAGKMRPPEPPAITARILVGILHQGHTYIQSVRYAEGYEIVDLPCNIVEARWQLCSVWWTKPQ